MNIQMNQCVRWVISLFAVLLCLAACGSQPSLPGTTLGANLGASTGRKPGAIAILMHAPVGTADLIWFQKQQTLTVKLRISGLAPNSTHPAHVHLGTCQTPGAILFMLPPLVANAVGQANLSTTIEHVASLPRGPWLINIHNGPTMQTALEQQAIACAPISLKSTSSIEQEYLDLQGTGAPNEAASGVAWLSLSRTGVLTVRVGVRGLAPGSVHAVHVHAGSCAEEGKVLFPLNPLVADAHGVATETMTFPHVTAIPAHGWYVNVHFGAAVNTQQLFNPIMCGDVHLSV
jgi:hypothetical protein